MTPRISVVIPAYEEGDLILPVLDRIFEAVTLPVEVLVVVDSENDSTIFPVTQRAKECPQLRSIVNTYGRGPGHAIRFGLDNASAPVTVVTMADGSDDPMQINDLGRLIERGVVVAAASRYMRAGQQVGGPVFKSLLSSFACRSLYWFGRVGTHDATNSFKAYNTDFIHAANIESDQGFEIGIELVAKARRARLPVAEVPTIWLDRAFGVSNFKIWKWIPAYLKWYVYSFGFKKPLDGYIHKPVSITNEGNND